MPTMRFRRARRRRSIAGSCPGSSRRTVQAELQQLAGPKVEVTPDPNYIGDADAGLAAPARRADGGDRGDRSASTGRQMHVFPVMSTGASDGSFFRAQGIPVYDVDGSWGISPDDERAHGLDERIPVRAMYDDVLHWEMIFKALAGLRLRRGRQLPRRLQHFLGVASAP